MLNNDALSEQPNGPVVDHDGVADQVEHEQVGQAGERPEILLFVDLIKT